ncbi:MAG: NAD(P)/FAD-dependent oxidoreductase [Gemmatimonadaceae bacterium]
MKFDAIVIGAGPNGLVAAAMLAKRGRKVLVVESADEIGGHTRTIEFAPGYHSPLNEDCGWVPPKVSTVLGLGDSLARVTPSASTSVAKDGELLTLASNPRGAAETIRRLSEKDASRWPAFVERLHKFAGILGELYQLTPPDIDTKSIAEILPMLGVGRKLRALGRNDMTEFLRVMPMSVQDLLDDTFESELLKAAVASAAIRDIQQGPRSGGTTYNLLHYMVGAPEQSVRARMWWRAGPDAFAKAAADVARKHGVEIRTRARVERISVGDAVVTGVVLGNGEEIEARMVISTADPKRTLLGMLDPVWFDPEFLLAVANIKLRGCTAYAFYAIGSAMNDQAFGAPVSLTASTAALEKAADAAKYGEISSEPHVEFFAPTLRWHNLAPQGKHVVAARVQYAPHHPRSGPWSDAQRGVLQEKLTAALARAIPGFASSILHRALLSPLDIEERFGMTEGALTQGELTLDQILFMRPVPGWGHYAMPVKGLYLGGAGAHPGPGVLGGPGFLAAKAALSG